MRLLNKCASVIACVAASSLLSGCMLPGMYDVASKFQREHPQYQIIRVTMCQQALEGQTVPAYAQYHIVYRKPGDTAEHERVCRYHQAAEAAVFDGCEDVR